MFLQEDQVNVKSMAAIFEGAFMDITATEGNGFSVKGIEFPFPLNVRLEPELKAIRFADFNRLYKISEKEAALICNDANKSVILGRFYAMTYKDAIFVTCQYQMSYEKGLIPFQVMANFRLFEKVAGTGVQCFADFIRP